MTIIKHLPGCFQTIVGGVEIELVIVVELKMATAG